MATANVDEAPTTMAATRKLTFLDLPEEVQKEVFAQCSQSDLICLSLVSKLFRELAAAQLYRNFHIVFPDEDDPAYDSPIDGLAGGLDTFVTSDYDYAKHLRDLSLDTLSAGDKAEAAYKNYLYSASCGKFMNTLLLQTMRKAIGLETFKWNIRVELSRPVYQALHRIETLKNVHIRLQVGSSLYETPPPLPYSPSSLSTPSTSAIHLTDAGPPGPPPPPQISLFGIPPPTTSMLYVNTMPNQMLSGPPPSVPKPSLRAKAKKPSMSKEPPTLSGFKKLRSLAVLDMDTLDTVTEIKACIRNSSSTLTKLKLSFSDHLALQARKPQVDTEMDDSDPDDEFQVVPGPPHPAPYSDTSLSLPARAFRAAEERKSQEAVLGRIFDVEPYVCKKTAKRTCQMNREAAEAQSTPEDEDPNASPARKFLQSIKSVSNKIMRDQNRKDFGVSELSASQQEILDMLENAARKYIASDEVKARSTKAAGESSSGAGAAASSSKAVEHGSKSTLEQEGILVITTGCPAGSEIQIPAPAVSSGESAAAKPTTTTTTTGGIAAGPKDTAPEDINIEEPEEQLVLDGLETSGLLTPAADSATPSSQSATPKNTASSSTSFSASGPVESPGLGKAIANLTTQKLNVEDLDATLKSFEEQSRKLAKEIQEMDDEDRLVKAEQQVMQLNANIRDIQQEIRTLDAEMTDALTDADNQTRLAATGSSFNDTAADADAQGRRVSEYIRATRGLQLESLSIYLVPVRASVLSKAIDLRVLRRITLLNVGPQNPVWTLFAKENKQAPLPLRKIFTDNVTPAFLSFVSQLEELHEFMVLERDHKYKPEPFATKTSTTIEQIRRLVLKRHLPTLKRLMIKNMDSTDWDIDEQTTRLICRKGRVLEELAVSMNIRAVHTLAQYISGLAELHALHIIQLRNDDTCVWVMRETKKFLIDNLSHYPQLKLEWLSVDDDDRLEKIVRVTEEPKKKKKNKGSEEAKGKGKEKATTSATPASSSAAHPSSSHNAAAGYGDDDDVFPVLPSLDAWDTSGTGAGGAAAGSGSDEESDSDEDEDKPLKLETLEGVHFADVWGVRIFKKEVVTGRL